MRRNDFIKCIVGGLAVTLMPIGDSFVKVVEDSTADELTVRIAPTIYADSFKITEDVWNRLIVDLNKLDKICVELCGTIWKSVSNIDSEGYRTVRAFDRNGSNDYAGYGEAGILIHDFL